MKLYDVFLSYRRSDGLEIAEALYRYLTSRGLRVFFDLCEMVDGDYFTTQIEKHLRSAPNYVLIASQDVFSFRQGEDWVHREIEIALEEYEDHPVDRGIVVFTQSTVTFPEKETMDAGVKNIADVQRIVSPTGGDLTAAFERILTAVTQVTRQNLWRASHRWLENSKRPGGRFASLSIVESILPNARQRSEACDIPVWVTDKPADQKDAQAKPLFDAVSGTDGHLFLIGQGGIGKTTALMHIMNGAYEHRDYSPDAQIPIFVELSFAPDVYDTLYEKGKSSYIRRAIYRQIRMDRMIRQVSSEEIGEIDEVFMLPYKVAVDPINDILSRSTPAPEYLLLLDGLNEVSTTFLEQANATVVRMIVEEINLLMTQCPNVRVVLTSRTNEISVLDNKISRFYLSGVEEDAIRTYLEAHRVAGVDTILWNRMLVETLKIPLFLTAYASLSDRGEASSQGEIFRLFFHERRKNIQVYTVQNRLAEVEKNVYDTSGLQQQNRLTADMQNFILDFLLPEIAWYMERNGLFYLRPNQIAKIIQPVLEDTSDSGVCGDFGKEVFTKFQQGNAADIHTQKVAEDILDRLGGNISKAAEKIINCCVFALGILQGTNRKYGFIHQHIRDYFAAMKCINTLRLAVYLQEEGEMDTALACMNAVFRENPVSMSVRRFMGETLGEHHNRPIFRDGVFRSCVDETVDDRMLIQRSLDVYRGRFSGEGGYGLHTLLKILTEVRGKLAGCDLSYLDLTGCHLNGAYLGVPGLAADVTGAKIQEQDLFFHGHVYPIEHMAFSTDASMLLTAGCDSIKLWDTKTGHLLRSFPLEEELEYAAFGEGDAYILCAYCLQLLGQIVVKKIPLSEDESGATWVSPMLFFATEGRMLLSPDRKHLACVVKSDAMEVPRIYKTKTPQDVPIAGQPSDSNRLRGASVYILSTSDLEVLVKREYETKENIRIFADYLPESSQVAVWVSQAIYDESKIEWYSEYDCSYHFDYANTLEVWDLCQRELVKIYETPETGCLGYMAAAGRDRILVEMYDQMAILDISTGTWMKTIPTPEGVLKSIRYHGASDMLSVITSDAVCLYDASNLHRIQQLQVPRACAAFSDNDSMLALSPADGKVTVYDLPLLLPVLSISGDKRSKGRGTLAYSPDGSRFAIVLATGYLCIWDAKTQVLLDEIEFWPCDYGTLAFSPDGNHLYYSSRYYSCIFSASDLRCIYKVSGELVCSGNGKYLAANEENASIIMDAADLHTIRTIPNAKVLGFMRDYVIVGNLEDKELFPRIVAVSIERVESEKVAAVFTMNKYQNIRIYAENERYVAVEIEDNLCIWDCQACEFVQFLPGAKLRLPPLIYQNYVERPRFAELLDTGILETGYFEKADIKSDEYILIGDTIAARWESSIEFHNANSYEKIGGISPERDSYCYICRSTGQVAELYSDISIYEMENPDGTAENFRLEPTASFSYVPGLQVLGVDMRRLHPDSRISEENRNNLHHHGARIR